MKPKSWWNIKICWGIYGECQSGCCPPQKTREQTASRLAQWAMKRKGKNLHNASPLWKNEISAGIHYKADCCFCHESLERVWNVSWVAFCGRLELALRSPSCGLSESPVNWLGTGGGAPGGTGPCQHHGGLFNYSGIISRSTTFSPRFRLSTLTVRKGIFIHVTRPARFEYRNMLSKCYQKQIFIRISNADSECSCLHVHNKQRHDWTTLEKSRRALRASGPTNTYFHILIHANRADPSSPRLVFG